MKRGSKKELGYLLMGVGLIGLYCVNNMRGKDLTKGLKDLSKQMGMTNTK